ncbi:MAG: hypothetical protein WBP81_31130, partial [Solirubrobacteraceae bacterium]
SELTSITSITSFTTSHIASSRRSKGPFVHVVHAEMAASHKATSRSLRPRLIASTSDDRYRPGGCGRGRQSGLLLYA